MKSISRLLPILLVLVVSCTQKNVSKNTSYKPTENSNLLSLHPSAYMEKAAKEFNENRKDSAVKWYYIAQMRFRAHLEANPDLDKSGDPALYSALKYSLGTPINEYAGGDPEKWAILIQEAIDWNKQNDNLFTSKTKFPEIYSKIENSFIEFKSYVVENKDEIIRQRIENGLDNR